MTVDIPATDPIPFGEWRPDLGNFAIDGALLVQDCVPYNGKYKPFYDLAPNTEALPAACKGAHTYRDSDGNVTIFAGTQTGLYMLDGTAWEEVTRGVSTVLVPYTMGADDFWCFETFGTLVIATNYVNDIQVFDMATDTEFSQLSATAPRARWIAVIKNFLVAIDTVDGDGAVGYRVRWSPLGDPTGVWGSDPDTQTDFQDISESQSPNRFITKFGDFGIIVQGRAIYRMEYVGGDTIFNINLVDQGRGSMISRSCIFNGQSIFMYSEDGFYEYNGGQMLPIGNEKIDQTFRQNVDGNYDYNITSAIDPVRKLALWSVPHTDAVGGVCNKLYIYSWVTGRWTIVNQELEIIFSFLTVGYTLEDLDDISASIDDLPFSLDSSAWTGDQRLLGGFSSSHILGLFEGDAKTAIIQTGEVRPNPSGAAQLSSAIPYVEGGTIRGRLGTRQTISGTISWTEYVDLNEYTGELDFDRLSVFHRLELEISGDWTIAHSVALRIQPGGVI